MLSAELAYNMQLYYEGYDPNTLLKEARQKLDFERERLHRQPCPVNPFSCYLDQSSDEMTVTTRECTYCKCPVSDTQVHSWKVSLIRLLFTMSRMNEALPLFYAINAIRSMLTR